MHSLDNQKDTESPYCVLLVDDMPENLRLLSSMLTHKGYSVRSTKSGRDALEFLERRTPDVILLDIKMPNLDGFEVCRRIKANKKTSQIPVIFISALDDIEDKLQAFETGGVDYVTKPFQEVEVLARVYTHAKLARTQKRLEESYTQIECKVKERTAELEALKKKLEDENVYLQEEIRTHNYEEMIGQSPKIQALKQLIGKVASSNTTVLILGETGTGKELIARAIHESSDRKKRPLISVNCAALAAGIIESELFGHEKGAYTGAESQKIGRFELADKATIFLDEIGDLPLDLQAKLLRVLQEGTFERIGGTKTLSVDVRIIAATNRNLDKLVSEGKFRDDLYYRLSGFPIKSPSLCERKDDIPLLTRHFIRLANSQLGKKVEKIGQSNLKTLQNYHWPGNVRELENVIGRAMILSSGSQLHRINWLRQKDNPKQDSSILTLDQMQKDHIAHVLGLTNGKVSGEGGAASILGLKRTTLRARMKKLGIEIDKNIVKM